MQTKLTLRLDQKLISRAKTFAKSNGKSLSQMVADYFALLGTGKQNNDEQLTPVAKSLKGSLSGKNIEIEDYHRHLEDKYL